MTWRALRAQVAAETQMTLQRGETLLVTIGIPVVLLVFFSLVPVLPTGTRHRVDFLAPGVVALAVMSTAMVSLGIATAFERSYGVLKRLGATPLGRPALLGAKIVSVMTVEVIQVVVLVGVALALGWRPHPAAGLAVIALLLATVAFCGIGLAMAGAFARRGDARCRERALCRHAPHRRDPLPVARSRRPGRVRPSAPGGRSLRRLAPDAGHRHRGAVGSLGRTGHLGARRPAGGGRHLSLGVTRTGCDRPAGLAAAKVATGSVLQAQW